MVNYSFEYFSKSNPELRSAVMSVLEKRIENPDMGSEFERTVQKISHLPIKKKRDFLEKVGFDALLCFAESSLVGYCAILRDGEKMHAFALNKLPEYRHYNIAVRSLSRLVDDAFSGDYSIIQAGVGTNVTAVRALKAFQRRYNGGFKIDVRPETGEIIKIA
jgi:hypothetical protein